MEESSIYEYVVAKKGKNVTVKKTLLIIFYVIYVIVAFVVGGITKFLLPCLALVPLSLWIIVFFTWRYAKVEYEYSINSGELTFSEIYGGRSRRVVTSFKLKDCTLIAPLNDEYSDQAKRYGAERSYFALSSSDAPDAYFAEYTVGGKKCIFYFEATARTLKICRFYNSCATVSTSVSR